jgi:hypothetical protein
LPGGALQRCRDADGRRRRTAKRKSGESDTLKPRAAIAGEVLREENGCLK